MFPGQSVINLGRKRFRKLSFTTINNEIGSGKKKSNAVVTKQLSLKSFEFLKAPLRAALPRSCPLDISGWSRILS